MHGFGGPAPVSRAVLLAILAVLLAAPLVQAAPWLQPRGDTAATGFQSDEGPEWPDVALRVEIPDPFTQTSAQPLIVDDRVLMLVAPHDDATLWKDPWRVLSMNLTSGNLSTVVELPRGEGPSDDLAARIGARGGMATDGETLYVAGNLSVHAIRLGTAGHEWTQELGARDEDAGAQPCGRLRLEPEQITVACFRRGAEEPTGALGPRPLTLISRLDATTGEPLWTWTHPRPAMDPEIPVPGDDVAPGCRVLGSGPIGLATVAPLVVVQTVDVETCEPSSSGEPSTADLRIAVRGLDATTGAERWGWRDEPYDTLSNTGFPGASNPFAEPARVVTGNPAVSEQAVYAKSDAVHRLAFGNGEAQWSQGIGDEDLDPGSGLSSAVALADGRVYAMSGQTLYQMGVDDPRSGWSTTLNQSGGRGFLWDPIVTPSTIYAGTSEPHGSQGPGPLSAFDVETGEIRWTQQAEAPASFAVGHGLLVYAEHIGREGPGHASDDFIVVLGRTHTSPTPVVSTSSRYPAPGEPVEVSLSDSEAGLQGAVTKYMAIWGDGTTTDWQENPVLTHTYEQPGNATARFIVGNDANQTASTLQTFDVGGQPPHDPTFLETAFARDNQDLTFGILGIILAIGGTIVGVVARRRHESHEADRLEAYERVVATEIAEGRADEDLTGRMAPMRAALGVSEKEHARLVEALLARRAGTSVALVPGEMFLARYEVIARLGAGGGGTTYLCHDQRIDRQVVIKALHATEQDTAATVREARAFGAVSHENVVALHDVEQVGDRVFLVLEHVPGGSLDGWDEPPGLDRLAEDLLSGLSAVHEAGIVHRDVKPSNLLVTEAGRFKLADFGIAHTPGFQTSIGGLGGGAVGTVQYMSPEQARGRDVDHRSDLYSAALVLWEALTGGAYMEPEPGETATELQMRIAQADGLPRVPADAGEDIAAWFEKALDPDPDERFGSAEEMLEALTPAGRNGR